MKKKSMPSVNHERYLSKYCHIFPCIAPRGRRAAFWKALKLLYIAALPRQKGDYFVTLGQIHSCIQT
eukprot:scaffold17268_cov90-Skeletonema_dohrnii-CCMP3373.AAC.3